MDKSNLVRGNYSNKLLNPHRHDIIEYSKYMAFVSIKYYVYCSRKHIVITYFL